MRRHYSVYLIVTVVFCLAFVVADDVARAASCALTKAQWGLAEVKTGQSVDMRIYGTGCAAGEKVKIVISSGNVGTINSNIIAVFGDGGFAKGSFKFSSDDLSGAKAIVATFYATAESSGSGIWGDNIKVTLGSPTPSPTNPPGPTGKPVTLDFEIKNPLKIESFLEFFSAITVWLTNIAIPIAVILIVYAGILFLTAGAVPANITKARTILTYVVVGLAIILIGRGFITLIESVLNLGASPSPTATPAPECLVDDDCGPGGKCLNGKCITGP